MWVLLLLGAAVLAFWLVGRGRRVERDRPAVTDRQGHELVEALYRDGVRLGFRGAWQLQVRAEEARVQAFVSRRRLVVVTASAVGVLLAAVPLAASVGLIAPAGLRGWAPWHWLLLAVGAFTACLALGLLLMPRDYRRFSAPAEGLKGAGEWADAEALLLAQPGAGASLSAMKAYLAAFGEERFGAGVRQGQAQAVPGLETRVSSAANAAYVQGKADGAVEARAQVSQLTTQAYLRGVGDGERTALTKLEGRMRAEREAAYRSGYRVGVTEAASAAQARKPADAGSGAAGRPRTRLEALALFELRDGAQPEDVRRRYRELQAALHPDAMRGRKAPEAVIRFMEEQFKLVGEAYAILERQF